MFGPLLNQKKKKEGKSCPDAFVLKIARINNVYSIS